MEYRVIAPEASTLPTLREVIHALKNQGLLAHHDHQNWGDWLNFENQQSVIAIELVSKLVKSAVIEVSDEEEAFGDDCLAAFRDLDWLVDDEDGLHPI